MDLHAPPPPKAISFCDKWMPHAKVLPSSQTSAGLAVGERGRTQIGWVGALLPGPTTPFLGTTTQEKQLWLGGASEEN